MSERNSTRVDDKPAFLFYVSDWERSKDIRICDYSARGLWVGMMLIMWDAIPRGTLTVNGLPIPENELGRMTSGDNTIAQRLLTELEKWGVFDRLTEELIEKHNLGLPPGVIINRRMFYDWLPSWKKSQAGKKGMRSRWDKTKDNKGNNKPITK